MFGSSNAFGQSSGNLFGSHSAFGQTNISSGNPFAPKPFGGPSPFGSWTGRSIFSSTSTGVFGATQSSSPLSVSSILTFGAPTTPTFGTPGGSSVFGQQPAFGGFGASTQSSPFGSTGTQPSPFGSTVAQSQPSFGSNLFGSTAPFGASNQPSFGAGAAQSFGASSTPSFGATSTPAFGSTATSTFGTSAFGSGGAFGTSSTPAFGSSTTPAFGTSTAPSFGATGSAPSFGTSSTPAFGVGSTPAFGSSSTPAFNFGSTPTFGQASSPFGSTSSFGAQSSPIGSQSTAPTFGSGFGQSSVGTQHGGSRIAPYTATPDADSGAGKLESMSAMAVYKEKSHEELRWEDYQRGDKGGPNPAGQPTPGTGFGGSSAQSSPFGQSSSNPFSTPAPSNQFSTPASSNRFSTPASSNPFSTPAASNPFSTPAAPNPFSTPAAPNPFAAKPSPFGSTGLGTSSSPFGSSGISTSTTANPFGASSTAAPSLFTAPATSAFGSNTSTSVFGTSSSSTFGSSPSIFGSTLAQPQGTNSPFGSGLGGFPNTSSQQLQSSTPSIGQPGGTFRQSGSLFGQTSAAPFGQSSVFNAPSSFGGGLLSSSSQPSTSNLVGFGQTTPSLSNPFPSTQSTQTNSAINFGNFNQTQPSVGAFGGGSNMVGQNIGQLSATQSAAVAQSVQNPFGVLPPVPQMSTGLAGTSSSIHYGISSMPVVDKPAPLRISSVLTSRHMSQRRIKLPARKYHPKSDGPKVAFFSEDETTSSTPKADAIFMPRENPRALIIQPKDRWPLKANTDKSSALNGLNHTTHENGKMPHDESHHMPNGSRAANKEKTTTDPGTAKEQNHSTKGSQNHYSNGIRADHQNHKGDSSISLTGHRAGEAAIAYQFGADIEALMPKLRHPTYYTDPIIQELAAKERAEPGFCRSVKNFVVGRNGYGSIKFLGETDVRRLDLESLIQFNNREVIVYLDDTKKPPVGQGLNKPAEVTLLNIKFSDKTTGQQYTEGPKIEKYKEMLKRKAANQGAEFLSYDPVNGEWKFRVSHFSKYRLDDEDDEDEDQEGGAALC